MQSRTCREPDDAGRPGRWAGRALALLVPLAAAAPAHALPVETERAGSRDLRPAPLEAHFPRESYRPGSLATLQVKSPARRLTLRVLHAGSLPISGIARHEVRGDIVLGPRNVTVPVRRGLGRVPIRVRDWPSGVYFAQVRAPSGRVAHAPFVVLPAEAGRSRVAVVMPTNTWQAYNRRDADRDGIGDTWYEHPSVRTVDLRRPYLERGVPPNFSRYDLPFLRWLFVTGKEVDVLSQRELERSLSADGLARRYDLVVFPGHHEYVTRREYDVVRGYRDRGGNLAFLSANNFFWHVTKRGATMTRTRLWRQLGRPEAALVGVQFVGTDGGARRAPYTVTRSEAASWLYADTGLSPGSTFGSFGIEIDRTVPASPRSTEVVARIRNLFGPGKSAEMTYYTRRGARVFAAGAFTLGGSALMLRRLLENVWTQLTADGASARE
jgi:hypothetical protein